LPDQIEIGFTVSNWLDPNLTGPKLVVWPGHFGWIAAIKLEQEKS